MKQKQIEQLDLLAAFSRQLEDFTTLIHGMAHTLLTNVTTTTTRAQVTTSSDFDIAHAC